jgi:hypothetical protein
MNVIGRRSFLGLVSGMLVVGVTFLTKAVSAAEVAADEIRAALDLPEGYSVTVHNQDHVLVSSPVLCFCLTSATISEGSHVEKAQIGLPLLIAVSTQYHNGL